MPRWLRRLLFATAGFAALVVVLGGVLLLLLQTAPAKRLLAERLETELAAATGFGVDIGAVEGFLPFSATVSGIRLSDSRGPWLAADRLELAWRPAALFAGRLHVRRVAAGKIAIAHAPVLPDQPEEHEPGVDLALGLPQFPLPVTVDEVRIERLALAPEVLGTAAVLQAVGQASLGGTARDAAVALEVTRLDGGTGRARLQLAQGGTPADLTLTADVDEPQGGLIARALALSGLPPVSLRLAGGGPASAWRGRLEAAAGPTRVDADLTLAVDDRLALTVEGRVQDIGRMAPASGAYIPPSVDIATSMRWQPGRRLDIERLALTAPEASAELSGGLDFAGGRIQASLDLAVTDATRWRSLLGPAAVRSGHLAGTVAGTLDEPAFELQTTIDGIAAPNVAAERTEAKVLGRAILRDRHVVTDVSIVADGRSSGMAVDIDPPLAALLGDTANWSLRAGIDLMGDDIEISQVRVAAKGLTIEGAGSVGGFGRAIDVTVGADLADIAPVMQLLDMPGAGRANLKARLSGDALAPRLTADLSGALADLAIDEPTVAAVLGPAPVFSGTITATSRDIDIAKLAIDGAAASVTAGGRVSADARLLQLNVAATVPEVAPVAASLGVAARGQLASRLQLTRTPEQPLLHFAGTAESDGLVIDEATTALLGPAVHASAEGSFGPAGVDLDAARIEGTALQLAASGRVGDTLALSYQLQLPRLAALSPLAGADLQGALAMAGDVSGSSRSPAFTGALTGESVRVADIGVASVEGQVSARDLGTRPLGDAALHLLVQGQRLSLSTSYEIRDGGTIALNDLQIAAPEALLTGNLALLPAGLVDGRVDGSIRDLAPLGSVVGQSLAGTAMIALAFVPAESGQAIRADLGASNLSLDTAEGAPVTAEHARLTADLRDAFGAPAGRAELRIGNAASGALRLSQSTIAIDGNAKAMTVRLSAAGEHGRPLAVDAVAELALQGAAQRLRLDSLDASFGALQVKLNAPATLSRDGGTLALAGLDAAVGDGHLTGAGRLGTGQVDLQLSLADLPLEIVSAFAPQVDLGGAASADLRLAGDVAAPAAHADFRLADLRVGGTRIGATAGVDGTATLDVREGRGSVTAKFGGPADFALDGQVTAPLAFGLQPFVFELADTAPIAGTVDGRVDLALISQVIDLQGNQLGGRLDLDMTVDGTLAAPRLVGEARIAQGSYATAAGPVVRNVEAVVSGDNDRIVLRSLTANDGAEGRLSASGSATLGAAEAGRYAGDVTLTSFAIPGGDGTATAASGHVTGNLQLAGTDVDGRRRFAATADASDLVVDGRDAGIFGPRMQASLDGALGDDASILIESARIEGADGRFTAQGEIAQSIELDYRLELSRLAALSSLAGVALDGSADVAGKVTGPRDSPAVTATMSGRALRVADVELASVEGTVHGRDLGGAPQGDVDLAVTAQGRRLSLATPYRVREDGAIALDGLRFTAPQTSLAGDLALSPGGLLAGRLRGDIGDLALLDPFIHQSVAGAATLDLSFAPSKSAQAVKADVGIRKLALGGPDGATLTAERVTLMADLGDVLGTPSGQAELRIENAASGALSLTRATVTVDGAGKAMQVRLGAAGEHGKPFAVDAAGELALAPAAQRLRLDRLDARFGSIDARLNAPATLSRDDRAMSLADLDAAIGKGRITGSGNLGRREVALQLALADLPLDIVSAFAPQLHLGGTVSADLRLAGTPAAPTAHGEVRLNSVSSGGTKITEGVALDGTVTVDLQDGRGSLTAKVGGPADLTLDGQVAAPVAFRAQPFALAVAPDAPLSGKVTGRVDLGLVPRIVDLYGDTMGGRLTLDMSVAGTRAAPRLVGEARLADGSYASAEAGTTLRNIEATLSGDNDRVVVRSLTATDGGQGRLSASGSAALGGVGAPRYDGEMTLERFTILNRTDAVATASGRLRLENAAQRSQLAGDVTVDSAELRIPESLPPEIVKIDVIEVNVPPGRTPAAAAPAQERVAPPLGLAVTVTIPGRAFLRGRGLESEWRGKLRVAGTMAAPDITGRLEVVRGGLDLLGTPFEVESGTVTFIGGDKIDPELDFTAGAEANDINARVRVTGFASAPKFDIGSDSGLPPEEALSRLLFGQSAGSLTPGQAVQLAQAAATLSGGGPGVLDKLRSSVGLDVLSLESGGESPEDTRVKAGKYVSDKVFLKVEQGVTAESRQVGVEVRVLPRVTVEGGVGDEGSGKVGVNWRYDY